MTLARRRFLMFCTATAASATIGGMVWRARTPAWSRGPKLRGGQPILRMPISAGQVALCQQGNSSPPGFTHSGGNCLYALDLSNCAEETVEVVAAASGRVSYLYRDSTLGDSSAGLRFGNHVKVDHGHGYFTFYSHLEKVTVNEGDIVRSGDVLGTMGNTGAAGNRHLHFSLHQGAAVEMGVGDSTPIRALITANVHRNLIFQSIPGSDFIGGGVDLWSGRIYGSENSPDEPMFDHEARGELRERLQAAYERLRVNVEHRILLDDFARAWEGHDAAWAEQILAPILKHDPQHSVARYWFGTAVHSTRQSWDEAEKTYQDLLTHGMLLPTWEMWLRSCIHNRLGVVAIARKRFDDARSHFRKALELATAFPEREFAREHLRELRGGI